ncbi:MAG: hypothetical protein KIS92_00380 [Planctomycetota bacterium]|nr:hypothetical protein [Planctomycetota bacterium]
MSDAPALSAAEASSRASQGRTRTVLYLYVGAPSEWTDEAAATQPDGPDRELQRLFDPIVRALGGSVMKAAGGAFLVEFFSATDGVVCALAMLDALRQRNDHLPEIQTRRARAALDTGRVEELDGVPIGAALEIAQGLAECTAEGDVCLTEQTQRLVDASFLPSKAVGDREIPGAGCSRRIFRAVNDAHSPAIRRIVAAVRVKDGAAEIRGLVAQDRRAKRWVLAAAAVSLLLAAALVFGTWFVRQGGFGRDPAAFAREQLARGDAFGAYQTAAAALSRRPGDPKLAELAVDAAGKHVDDLARRRASEAALKWLDAEMILHEELQPLAGRRAVLDVEVSVEKLLASGKSAPDVMDGVRELLARHPQPDVPVVAAARIRRRNLGASELWLYEEAFRRGFKATNLDIFDACVETLARHAPRAPDAQRAHELIRRNFPKERLAWAEKTLDKGDGFAWINAYAIVDELNLPKEKDPLYESLAKVLNGEEIDQFGKILLRLRKDERRRAGFILAKSLEANAIGGSARDEVETLAQKLRTE